MERKTRKSRFTHDEISSLLHHVSLNKKVLQSRHTNDVTVRQKAQIWLSITAMTNNANLNGPQRTLEEVKKKWSDLKQSVIKYRTQCSRTSGGPPPKIPPYFDSVMDIMGDEKALLHGVEDTDVTELPESLCNQPTPSAEPVLLVSNPAGMSADSSDSIPVALAPTSPSPAAGGMEVPEVKVEVKEEDLASEGPSAELSRPAVPDLVKRLWRKRYPPQPTEEDQLWRIYLREHTELARAQRELVRVDLALKQAKTEYYKKKMQKLDDV